jgi:thiamine kinase-like enzyme
LLCPKDPLKAILEECEQMVRTYMESPLGQEHKKKRLRKMLDIGWKRVEGVTEDSAYRCCINTELNSTNFLINGEGKQNYLIDWEKPLYGEPAQDLGHFLAPTTTFWKTDVILTKAEMDEFLDEYIRRVDGRFCTEGLKERTALFVPITCLRGVTWCAMAWVEYQQPDRLIFNESTFRKLDAYLDDGFLDFLEELI